MQKSYWLITGGAGFIGSNFISYIFKKYPNDFIICFDNLTYAGDINNFSEFLSSERFVFIKGDISSVDDVNFVFKKYKIDYVVNFAAESHVDRSISNSRPFIKSNIEGVANLLEVIKNHKIKRFHQVSTDEVYGSTTTPVDENAPLKPSSAYAASKAAADLICYSFFYTFNLPISISRCTNNYGIMQNEEKFIPNIVSKIASNKSIEIYGDGKNKRDWIHVLDHCEAIDLIMHKGECGQIYNVATGHFTSNNELAILIANLLNFENPKIKYIEDRLGHDYCYSIDTSKIEKELNWAPKRTLEKDLENVLKWYLNKCL